MSHLPMRRRTHCADWLVGMNLSRAYTLTYGDELSVGRVQTPTLAMVVERELAVRRFVPEDYLEVVATFRPTGRPEAEAYQGTWFRDIADIQKSARLPAVGEAGGVEAAQIVERTKSGAATIESIKSKSTPFVPPPLVRSDETAAACEPAIWVQRAAHAGHHPATLYEKHKLISYPRTDSRHLSQDVAGTLLRIGANHSGPVQELFAPAPAKRPLGRRYVDDRGHRSPRDYPHYDFAGARGLIAG